MECSVSRIQGGAPETAQDVPVMRVAAYCRVSTDREEQQTSLREQMDVFRRRISEHPGWQLAGIYADEGLSATSTSRRREFQRMLADAEAGRIDYIITKSISRFARNTLDCLTYIRRLKRCGVNLLFEKENIDTGSAMSEMILTVMAAFAQEESRSISENIKWGLRKGYENGQVRWQRIYGYRRGACGGCKTWEAQWVIEPDEAAVVRRIFAQYEQGMSAQRIADGLNAEGIASPGGKRWQAAAVLAMLGNEKYAGDIRTQKYVVADHLTHKAVRNTMEEVPSYYIRNHHEGIVSRRTFERVGRIRALRDNRDGTPQYPYGDCTLLCPRCSRQLVQRQMRTSQSKRIWCCFGEDGCRGYALKAWQLDEAVLDAWRVAGHEGAPETVEYAWLDEHVLRIEPTEDCRVIVTWRDGCVSAGRIRVDVWQHEPARILACYRRYIEQLECGERADVRPATPEDKRHARARGDGV